MSLPPSGSSSSTFGRMRGSSTSSPRFPLPERAFPSTRLSSAQISGYQSQIQDIVTNALNEYDRVYTQGQSAYSNPWEVVGAQDGITALRKRESGNSTRAQYRLMGTVSGDYRHIMGLHYAETSHELYEWHQFMYHHTLDAHVMQTFETATAENPSHYFGVKWTAYQLASFATKVDECFVEYMTYRKDLRGRDIGIRVMLPIQRPEIDHTMDAMKVRRLSARVVQIMRPASESNRSTQVFVMADIEFPFFVPAAYIKTLMVMVQNVPMCIDSRRIRRRGLISETKWVPNAARRSCIVCTKTFGATRGRHHCRLCGDVICRKCMLVRDTADQSSASKVFKITKTKFCVLCITNLREPDAEDLTASAITTSSKVRDIEFAPADFDESSRVSVWSETESEDCRTDFDYPDSTRSSLSSLSGVDADKNSFGRLRLDEISERIEAIDESSDKPKPTVLFDPLQIELLSKSAESDKTPLSKSAESEKTVLFDPEEVELLSKSAEAEKTVLFDPEETDTGDYIMTIDTKDMIRENQFQDVSSFQASPLSSSGVFDDFVVPERRRTASSTPLSSSRSIGQCLAEQEALLRQMVFASQGQTPRHMARQQQPRLDDFEYNA